MPMHLTARADLGVLYDSESLRYGPGKKMAMTRQDFITLCAGFPSIGFADDGVVFGGAIFWDNEMHVSVMPAYHSRWGLLMRPMWDWMFSIQDPVRLSVEPDNLKCLRLMRRQGWPQVGQDERYLYFLATRATLHPALRARTAARSAPLAATRLSASSTTSEPSAASATSA